MAKKEKDPNVDTSAMDVLSDAFTGGDAPDPLQDQPVKQGDDDAGDQEQIVFDDYDPQHPLYKEPEPEPEPDEGGQASADEGDGGGEADDEKEPEPPGDDANAEQRYRYWQSRHDKLKKEKETELTELKQQIEQLSGKYDQLATGGEKPKPEATIDDQIREKANALVELQKSAPKAPEKPRDYDATDAYSDPQSASFIYQRQLEEYNSGQIDLLRKEQAVKDDLYFLQMKKVSEPTQELVAKQKKQTQEQQTFDLLKNNYKLSDEEAVEFVRTMDDPKLTMDILVDLFRYRKGKASPPPKRTPATRNTDPKPKGDAAPPPLKGGSAGQDTDTPDDNDMFSASMLRMGREM